MITNPYTQALAWTLVHFLWQGAAIGLAAVAIWRYARLSASSKYGVGVALLAAMLAAPAATFVYLAHPADKSAAGRTLMTPGPVRESAGTASAANIASTLPAANASTPGSTLRPIALAGVLVMWLAGVGVFSVRLLGGWIAVRRLARRTVRPAAADIQALARRVAGRLALDRIVGIFESAAVSVPVMVGWVKPAVLLPAAALTGLSTVQLESLLAHELAHVRRHDYPVNLLQGLVETLLFYHPAVWWVSRQVRREREHCCDDLAVGVCDRLVYATALADLATLTAPRSFALAATDGALLDRVRRILGRKGDERASTSPWLPVSFVGLIAVAVLPIAFVSAQSQEPRSIARVEAMTPAVLAETPEPIAPVQPALSEESEQGGRGGVAGGVPGGVVADVAAEISGGVVGGVPGGVPGGVSGGVLAEMSDQDRAGAAEKITAIRRQLEETRDQVATASQQGADQPQIEELRKRIAALEAQLARMLVEQRDNTEASKRLTASQEALLKTRQQEIEQQSERLKSLFDKGLLRQNEMQRAELDKQREILERRMKERADVDKELRAQIEKQLGDLNQTELARQADRAKMLMKGPIRQLDAQRADEALKRKLAAPGLLEQLALAKAGLEDAALSEEARKLLSAAIDEKTSDNDVIDVFKNVSNLKEDSERASVLVRIARERPFTASMVSAYLAAANTIRSDYDRERVFRQPIKLKAGR